MRPLGLLMVVAGAAGLVACGGSRPERGALPDVALAPLEGASAVRLEDIEPPAVINLWATWCVPCRAEMPMLQQQYESSGDEVAFIGVNVGEDDAAGIVEFTDEVGVTYPQYLDRDGALSTALRVAGVPATVFVDRDGAYTVHSGLIDGDELASWVAEVTAAP